MIELKNRKSPNFDELWDFFLTLLWSKSTKNEMLRAKDIIKLHFEKDNFALSS